MSEHSGAPAARPWDADDTPAGEPFGPGGWAVGSVSYAVDGLVAGAVGLFVAEAGAALGSALGLIGAVATGGSPLLSVGAAVVDLSPKPLKDWAVATFGTGDKAVLVSVVAIVVTLVLALLGGLARRRPTPATVGMLALGVVASAAVLTRPGALLSDVLPTCAGIGLAVVVLRRGTPATDRVGGPTRREALVVAAGAAGVGLVTGLRGGAIGGATQDTATALPTGAPPPVGPQGAQAGIPGSSPWVVPNGDFYRIDTALVPPRLASAGWSLRVWGEVEREVVLTWEQLLTKPMVDRYVTLCCVSNEVGGDLVGNALWTGWPVRELLARAGPRAGADMVLSRSADGWTAGTPLPALTDGRDALLAVAMNGEPLPREHGFPVRLVVPGLYGYVSATKWVTELKVTRFAVDMGYWTPRGWSALGPVKTAARIDVPRSGARVTAGRVAVAGVAWAMHRGIQAVQVRVDDGPWADARLAAEPTVDAWRQWVYEWDATAGSHTLTVRARDGQGQWQTADVRPPDPDGATGLHTVTVTVG